MNRKCSTTYLLIYGYLYAILLCCCTGIAVAAENTLVLHEEAYVKGPSVLLSEVADIEGELSEVLGALEMTTAAAPGASKQVNASLVTARLRNAGFDTEKMEITGARRVRATTLYMEISREMIADSLRQFIVSNMPWESDRAEIDVPLPTNEIVAPEGDVVFEWRSNPSYKYVGEGAFRGKVYANGKLQRTLLCKAHVTAYGKVLMAGTDIPRGRIISPADLKVEERALETLPRNVVMNPQEIVGMVARKTIFPGNMIRVSDVEAPRLVKRNQLVSVEMRAGALFVQSRAKALMDARKGDVITCANLNSKERFQGVVRGDGVVVIP